MPSPNGAGCGVGEGVARVGYADPGYPADVGGLPFRSTVLFHSFPHSWQEKVCSSKFGRLSTGVRREIVIVPPQAGQGSLSEAPNALPGAKYLVSLASAIQPPPQAVE
jgi:hypothetical protein